MKFYRWAHSAVVFLALIALPGSRVGLAQDVNEEIKALRKAQDAMQKDIAEIKKMLQDVLPKPPKPFEPLSISLLGAPSMGDPVAQVTIVEFTDYQCPYCGRHVTTTMAQLKKEYVDTGKVRYLLRDFPLTSIHPRATKAAEAASCAGEQGKYWEMHGVLFRNQKQLNDPDLLNYGRELGLDEAALRKCLNDGKYSAKVQSDVADGRKATVTGTPIFFLGLTDRNDRTKILATKVLRGAQPFSAFKQAIDGLLASPKPNQPKDGV